MAPRMTAQNKKWQAESDADTLAQADVIRKTPVRLKAAVKEGVDFISSGAGLPIHLPKYVGDADIALIPIILFAQADDEFTYTKVGQTVPNFKK